MRRTPPTGPIRFEVYLDRDLHRHLRMASIEEGLPAAAIVRGLVEGWVGGQDQADDALRAAYDSGVRAERNRLRAVLEPAGLPTGAGYQSPDTSSHGGLPLRPPTSASQDTSDEQDTRCLPHSER